MKIGIDLDGCVVDYVTAIRAALGFSEAEAPDPWKWELWECWGMEQDEFWVEARKAYEAHLFFKAKAYPGALEALQELADLGHDLYYITARNHPVGMRDTVAWLEEQSAPYTSITFNGDKTCIPVDVMIEDNPTNAAQCQAVGIHTFLMDRPWNQGDTEVPRVLTWLDFVAEVQHLAARGCGESEAHQQMFRTFATGATRDLDDSKLDYEGFLSPLVLKRFAEYMHKNRRMADGSMRDGDNWQKGMPIESYVKSQWRHFWDVWGNHRGLDTGVPQDEALCAVLFNAMGHLHELLKEKET